MKFLRNNWYWILSIVIGIGSIITMHRVQQQRSEPDQRMPNEVAAHTFDTVKRPMRAVLDSSGRKTLDADVLRKHRPIRPNMSARINPALKNLEPIPTTTECVIEPPPPLPVDLDQHRRLMLQDLRKAGKVYEIRNGEKFKTKEAFEIELEALTGDMNPEEAIAFLEKHGHYNEAILSQVSAHRAFKYLKTIRASWEKVNEYAEKALADNPDDFETKMHLMLYEKDNAKAAAGYREILAKDPNDVGALLNLGYRMHYDDPVGALEHLIKGNKLDSTKGWGDIGMVYERLGDVKTAWLYYRKHLTFWNNDQLIRSHLSWINAGEPKYTPIHLERHTVPQHDKAVIEKGAVVPKEKPTPAAQERPWYPELPPEETHLEEKRQTDAAAARAAFERQQAAAKKEFDAFMKWAETVMEAGAEMKTNDFLTKELAAHLSGGETKVTPERLVRAFELMERHGRTDGLRHLKDKDPELAAEVERFLAEKRQPPRRTNQQNNNK